MAPVNHNDKILSHSIRGKALDIMAEHSFVRRGALIEYVGVGDQVNLRAESALRALRALMSLYQQVVLFEESAPLTRQAIGDVHRMVMGLWPIYYLARIRNHG